MCRPMLEMFVAMIACATTWQRPCGPLRQVTVFHISAEKRFDDLDACDAALSLCAWQLPQKQLRLTLFMDDPEFASVPQDL